MTLQNCGCGHKITTKNVQRATRTWERVINKSVIWFHCPLCGSTGCKFVEIKGRKMRPEKILRDVVHVGS